MSNTTSPRAGASVPAADSNNNANGTTTATLVTASGNGTVPAGVAANGTVPAPATGADEADSPPARRADQDQEIAAAISGTAKTIQIVLDDTAINKVMTKWSFKKEKLNTGLKLCEAAQNQWDARQTAIGRQTECTSQVNRLFNEAVKAYSDFRETARTELQDEASLQALSVTDAVPDELGKFLTHARGAYHCAKMEPYVSALGEYGYDEDGLDDQLKALDALDKADQEQSKAIADAQKATRLRDEAAAPVRDFGNKLRKIARRAFRNDPEQARKLDI